MFERSEFPAGPLDAAAAQGTDAQHRRKTGCPLLWLLSFGQANESHSRSSAKPQAQICPSVGSEHESSTYQAFGTHEFTEPSVSYCCATPFRLLVQTKGSKGKDARVTRRREARRTTARAIPSSRAEGCGPSQSIWLGSLWRSSNRLRAPAQCAGHPSVLRFSFAPHRARIQAASP